MAIIVLLSLEKRNLSSFYLAIYSN